jgi:hypothetical protein
MTIVGLALTACAAPRFDLRARFVPGEKRAYRLVADATVRFSFGAASTSERSQLTATATIDVVESAASGSTLLLTIASTKLIRDGKRATTPPPQQITIVVDPDGRVTRVTGATDQTSLASADIEDLVPLIGPPLPPGRVHVGDRWTPDAATPSTTPGPASPSPSPTASTGTEEARLSALRIVEGYRCAIVAISTRRPVVRERTIAGDTLRLAGIEFAASEIAFAFREGLPASVRSDSESRLAIAGGTAQGGSVVIATKTELTLLDRSLPS